MRLRSLESRRLLLQSFQGSTYCVNFHVVGLPSAASTMIPEPRLWTRLKAIRT